MYGLIILSIVGVLYELIETEENYVKDLELIIDVLKNQHLFFKKLKIDLLITKLYIKPLEQKPNLIKKEDLIAIFSNIELILPINSELLANLKSSLAEDKQNFGHLFLKLVKDSNFLLR